MKLYSKHIQKWSLTRRLLCFLAIISLVAWLIATGIAVTTSSKYIKTFFDTQQILLAKTLLSIEPDLHSSELPPTKLLLPFGHDKELKGEDDDALAFALFSAQGDILLTDGQEGKDFPFLPYAEKFSKVEVDGDEWRILWLHSSDKERIVAVGQELEYRNDMILHMILAQISPWIVILPFLLLGFGLALYRELRPLRLITRELCQRKAHDTSALAYENIPPEIEPLLHSLNILFERIGILLTQERAFVANAAHELRTPLTGLKIQAEVVAMSDEDPEARKKALQKILQAANKCGHLVEQLLVLSQLESQFSGNITENIYMLEPLHWEKLVQDACYESQEQAEMRHIRLEYTIHSIPVKIMGLPTLWSIVLRNILDNAIRYTPEGNNVHISLSTDKICVENSGVSIDECILPHLGKRFYRPAGQEASGSGLGLAIVDHIVTLHGARFSICNKAHAKTHTHDGCTIAADKAVLVCVYFEAVT